MMRQARWSRPTWQGTTQNDWQGDALGDLSTSRNVLSVYLVYTAEMMEQVVVGLAAQRDDLAHFDYAIISAETLAHLTAGTIRENGKTPNGYANTLHYNIVNLTGHDLFVLMQSIAPEDVRRIHWRDVGTLLRRAFVAGSIDEDSISAKIVARLNR